MRRVFRFLAGLLLSISLLAGGLLLLIYLSKERLIAWVIRELAQSFSAKIHLTAVEVGSLRALPALGLQLRGFLLQSKDGDTLFSAEAVVLHLNLWEALIEKNYRIEGLILEKPQVWLVYDQKGYTPWEKIFQTPSRSAEEPSPWALEQVKVKEGYFLYTDQKANFSLALLISSLKARLKGLKHQLHIQGQAEGQVQHLLHHKKNYLPAQPFSLTGNITYETDWLLFSPLHVGLSGMLTKVQGGIQLGKERPELSLRIEDLDIDLDRVKALWADAPSALSQLSGSLRAEGEILGPVGRGKLPRLRLNAALQTSKPFSIEDYPCQVLYAQGRLYWDSDLPKKSSVEVDSLYFVGGDSDTLYLRGKYGLSSEEISAEFYARLNLALLRRWKLPKTDSLAGTVWMTGSLQRSKHRWAFHGEGYIQDLLSPPLQINQVSFKASPDKLNITNLTGRYEDITISAPSLSVHSYSRLWDSTAAPLNILGEVHLSRLKYEPSSKGAGPPIDWQGDIKVRIDTFLWTNGLFGPMQAHIVKEHSALHLKELQVWGIGGGKVSFTGLFTPTLVEGEGRFADIDLSRLYQQLPQLDTLFPLLRHMQGKVKGELSGSLPLSQGKISWADVKGKLKLSLQNLVIVESPYTYELFSLIPLTDFRRIEVGQVDTRISLEEGVIRTDTTWLQANRWKMRVAGAHTLKGELAYDLLVEVPRILLDKSYERVKEFVEESEDERIRLAILVTGTTEKPKFSWKLAKKNVSPPAPKGKNKPSKRGELPVEEK
ncbi:MAG: AsmA-like C-terminal region-containing protein [Bacteroidia bacterium]|nr:AsmA-like C-terminal region-containing protein [Bacteroidia bacterium]MDW8056669.1 AsmA-like C-terminal region-containing protein [Bacteroidia bacterium]